MLKCKKFFNLSKFLLISLVVLLGAVFLCQNIVWAQGPDLGIEYTEDLGLADSDPRIAIVKLVRLLITFVGIIAVVYLLYSGYLWMTSAGNEEKIARAKKTLVNAIIGLIIILSAFLIVSFVINKMGEALSGGGPGPGGGPGSDPWGLGASGNSIIETHYPTRGQTGVPRNTSIAITFREPITVYGEGGLLQDDNQVNTDNFMIYKKSDPGAFLDNFYGTTTDSLTFVFRQSAPYIGSPSENIWHTVELSGDIKKADGKPAWPGAGGGYAWDFEASTIIDLTPPQVESIYPFPDSEEPRNVVIQINFNEAIDPVSAAGNTAAGFDHIETSAANLVEGAYYISNEYRTVEFLSSDDCGGAKNSCGEPIFCLPADSTIRVLAKAAELGTLNNGIMDMAANSLDGDRDGIAEGPGATPYDENTGTGDGDNYTWSFFTNNNIDISAPVIISYNPDSLESDVAYAEKPWAKFNKLLMSKSLNKDNIDLFADPPSSEVWYWMSKSDDAGNTTVILNHHEFVVDSDYIPQLDSGIRDLYQNCYFPSAGHDENPSDLCEPDAGAGLPYCCDGAQSAESCEP